MSLITLKGLEDVAACKFEKRADEWVRAVTKREGVSFEELRPHLVSLRYWPELILEITFIVPKHNPIKLVSDWMDTDSKLAKLEDGKLIGKYSWCTFKSYSTGSVGFHSADDLGQALLLARWAYEEDERAKWM